MLGLCFSKNFSAQMSTMPPIPMASITTSGVSKRVSVMKE